MAANMPFLTGYDWIGFSRTRLVSLLVLEKQLDSSLTISTSGSPMSLYDFYMYLKHIEFSAENLEFFVW